MVALTTTERQYLRSGAQRYRLYFVPWGVWQIEANTPLLTNPTTGDPEPNIIVTPSNFKTVLNIGSHRLAFVGEPIIFDASRSWKQDGTTLSGGNWQFSGATPSSASGLGPHSVTWWSPGLYEVLFTHSDVTAKRWVRVYQNRADLPYDVVSISSISGSVDQGWKMELTIAPSDEEGMSINLQDFQAVGLFCEEEWWDGNQWVRYPIGNYEPEPRLVMSGYIEQGSIQIQSEQHRVTFSVGNLLGQMDNATIHTLHNWNATFDTPTETGGIVFQGFTEVRTSDIMLWLLQAYTNVLSRHDFVTWSDNSLQNILQLSCNEGSLLGALRGWAEAEFGWLFADTGNGLRFVPNPHIRSAIRFGDLYPFRADLGEHDVLNAQLQEDLQRNVVWVQVRGVRIRDGKQFLGRYPTPTPPIGPGTWLIKDKLSIHSQAFADLLAQNFYNDANRRYTLVLTQPLWRAIGVPERIKVSLSFPDRGIAFNDKAFLVESVSYQIDVASGSWMTQSTAKEMI